jgi:hypothetical protein
VLTCGAAEAQRAARKAGIAMTKSIMIEFERGIVGRMILPEE